MNNQIRRLTMVITAMFVCLLLAETAIQFFLAPSYMADPRNQRAVFAASSRDRGPILIDGNAIAKSEPSNDSFHYQRVYTQGPLYALITGYQMVALSAPSTGLEASENDVLTGTAASLLTSRLKDMFTGQKPRGGALELTIDPALQKTAWDAIGDRRGAAIVMDAKTGAILAAVSKPSFDPNVFASHNSKTVHDADKKLQKDPNSPLNNRAFGSHLYVPGSVFKIVTTASLLENTDITPDTKVEAPKSIKLPQSTSELINYHGESCGSGEVTLAEAFARSCNTAFALKAMDLGSDKLKATAENFGYDQSLNIPLPVTPSQFPKLKSKAELAQTAIGQFSLQVSPLEIAMTTQAIANHGQQMKPYLVEQILDGELKVRATTSPQVLRQAVDRKVADQIKDMMKGVVDKPYGTAHGYGLDKYSVGAKTGTAEVGDTGRTLAWFTGFAPYDDPQIVVAVVLEGDQSWVKDPSGGKYAAPIGAKLFKVGMRQ